MWYVYYSVEQTDSDVSNNAAQSAVTLGTVVYAATNFTGLVRFNGTNNVEDGAGNGLSFGSTGTTTIDGGEITTGTINAARISLTGHSTSELQNNSGFITSSALSGYALTSALNSYATTTALAGKADATGNLTVSGLAGQLTSAGVSFKASLIEDVTTDVNANVSNSTLKANFQSAMTAAGINLTSTIFDANGTTPKVPMWPLWVVLVWLSQQIPPSLLQPQI